MSNTLVLRAIATKLLAQRRVSYLYDCRHPRGNSQNETFLLPHRTQSAFSTSSQREQNCCTQTRLSTWNFASSVYLVLGGSLEFIEYGYYIIICGEQRVFQRCHIAQVNHVSLLLSVLANLFITSVISVRNKPSTRPATSLSFAFGQIDTGLLE